jgi:hypothetical protein
MHRGVEGNNNTCAMDVVLMRLAFFPMQLKEGSLLQKVVTKLRTQGFLAADDQDLSQLRNQWNPINAQGNRAKRNIEEVLQFLEKHYGLKLSCRMCIDKGSLPGVIQEVDPTPLQLIDVNQESTWRSPITSLDFKICGNAYHMTSFLCRETSHFRLFQIHEDGSITYFDSMAAQDEHQCNISCTLTVPGFRQFLTTLRPDISLEAWGRKCTEFFTKSFQGNDECGLSAQHLARYLTFVRVVVVQAGPSVGMAQLAACHSEDTAAAACPRSSPEPLVPRAKASKNIHLDAVMAQVTKIVGCTLPDDSVVIVQGIVDEYCQIYRLSPQMRDSLFNEVVNTMRQYE